MPIPAGQSVGYGQVTGWIEQIEGGEHGEIVTVIDAGVLHYRNFELDLAGPNELKSTPPADGPAFNRWLGALSQSQPILGA